MTKIASVRIELDFAGVGDLLASAEMQHDLDRRAEAVAKAARNRGITVESDNVPLPIEAVSAGAKRARALVSIEHPAGLAVEAKYRLLVGCLDAARSA